MRYQIFGLQQQELIRLGLSNDDSLLLDFILSWKDGGSMERIVVDGNDIAYWFDYVNIARQLPILFTKIIGEDIEILDEKHQRQVREKIGRMLNGNLKKVLKRHTIKVKGRFKTYISFNREAIDSLKNNNDKKNAPNPTEKGLEDKNNNYNNSICSNKEKYTSNEEKDKKYDEIVEILKTNNVTNINSKKLCEIKDVNRLKKCIDKTDVRNFNYILAMYVNKYTFAKDNNTSNNKNKFNNFDSTIDSYNDDVFERANKKKWAERDLVDTGQRCDFV